MTSAGTAAAWLIALATIGQLSPEKQTAAFTVSPGLEIKLWASEPLFVNPTTFDIDHLGAFGCAKLSITAANYADNRHYEWKATVLSLWPTAMAMVRLTSPPPFTKHRKS